MKMTPKRPTQDWWWGPAKTRILWWRESKDDRPVAYQDASAILKWDIPQSSWKTLAIPPPLPPLGEEELPLAPSPEAGHEIDWVQDSLGHWVGEDRCVVKRKINSNDLSPEALANLNDLHIQVFEKENE